MALSNTQYNTIERIYDERRRKHRLLQEDRQRELYNHLPILREVDSAFSSASVRKARLLLEGKPDALSDLKEELDQLRARKAQIIAEGGYPADYLDMTYDCPLCRDTGYVDGVKCKCFKQLQIDLLYQQSSLNHVFQEESFDTFDINLYDSNVKDNVSGKTSYEYASHALETCHGFVDHFQDHYQNLFIYGDVGTGKTFLTHCIAGSLIKQGYAVVYLSAFEIFDIFDKHVFKKDEDVSEEYDHIFRCDLLIIDDLGTEFSNSFTVSQFFSCLNERLINKKPIVLSTNLNMKDIAERYSERSMSRILGEFQSVKMSGEDLRQKVKELRIVKKG